MSELKIVKQSDVLWGHWFTEYYIKSEADKYIAELEAKNDKLELYESLYNGAVLVFEDERKDHSATRRALWLARAERAKERKTHFDSLDYFDVSAVTINFESARTWMTCRIEEPSKWAIIFEKVEQKCRAKAEEETK